MGAKPISVNAAIALLSMKLGGRIWRGKVERAIKVLASGGVLEQGEPTTDWVRPEDLDAIEGEVRRMCAGWYQRRNVAGDFQAWLRQENGEGWPVRLPYERVWNVDEKREIVGEPEIVGCWEWPTARFTGVLVRKGERDGLPAYEYQDEYHADDELIERLRFQWLTGTQHTKGNG